MSAEHSTQASATTVRLQEGARSGLPVLIPGAREPGFGSSDGGEIIADPAAASARAAAVFDRIRSTRVPREDPSRRCGTVLVRLWRRIWRGPEVAVSDPRAREAE